MATTWDPNVPEVFYVKPAHTRRQPFDIELLDDGRCKGSSWRGPMPKKPTYENHFGPGGFNRCIGRADHVNRTHKDEWGNVFRIDPAFFVVRREEPQP